MGSSLLTRPSCKAWPARGPAVGSPLRAVRAGLRGRGPGQALSVCPGLGPRADSSSVCAVGHLSCGRCPEPPWGVSRGPSATARAPPPRPWRASAGGRGQALSLLTCYWAPAPQHLQTPHVQAKPGRTPQKVQLRGSPAPSPGRPGCPGELARGRGQHGARWAEWLCAQGGLDASRMLEGFCCSQGTPGVPTPELRCPHSRTRTRVHSRVHTRACTHVHAQVSGTQKLVPGLSSHLGPSPRGAVPSLACPRTTHTARRAWCPGPHQAAAPSSD